MATYKITPDFDPDQNDPLGLGGGNAPPGPPSSVETSVSGPASGDMASFMKSIQPFLAGDEADMKSLMDERAAISTQPNPKTLLGGAGIVALLSMLGGRKGMSNLGNTLGAYDQSMNDAARTDAANKIDTLGFKQKIMGSEMNSKRGIMRSLASAIAQAKMKSMYPHLNQESAPADQKMLEWLIAHPKQAKAYGAMKRLQGLAQPATAALDVKKGYMGQPPSQGADIEQALAELTGQTPPDTGNQATLDGNVVTFKGKQYKLNPDGQTVDIEGQTFKVK
jgi:hypothetical protein